MTALYIGARDWDHPQWQGSYYPEDLPADWRLSYYANEFPAVLVNGSVLAGEQAPDWREETPSAFRFVVTVDAAMSDADVVADRLRDRLGAWLLPTDQSLAPPSLKHAPVCLHDPAAAVPGCRLWRSSADADCVVGLRDGADNHPPEALRETLEAFMAYANGASMAYLFLEGEPPHMDNLHQAKLLAELLGY